MRFLRAAFIAVGAVAVAGCHASYPFRPSPATPTALHIFYTRALAPQLVGASFGFTAYVFNSDGAWEDVTPRASWSSSNSVVAALDAPPSRFVALTPGRADVSVAYQGLVSGVPVTVYEPDAQPFPFLNITPGDPRAVGQRATASVSLRLSPTQTQSPQAAAEWASSDERVVTVAPTSPTTALVTATGPGTARITVTLNGVTGWYGLSVMP
jgi:hypothetical protein